MDKFDLQGVDIAELKQRVKNLEKHRWCLIIAGILMALLGIYAMFHPGAAILSLAMFIGFGFAVSGINHVIAYFVLKRDAADHPGWFMAQGIFEIILALILLSNLGVTALSIPLMVAFWAMFDGIMRTTASFKLKALGVDKWWVLLISGIISIIFALLLISRPFAGVFAITFLLGLTLVIWGVTAVFEAYHLYGAKKIAS